MKITVPLLRKPDIPLNGLLITKEQLDKALNIYIKNHGYVHFDNYLDTSLEANVLTICGRIIDANFDTDSNQHILTLDIFNELLLKLIKSEGENIFIIRLYSVGEFVDIKSDEISNFPNNTKSKCKGDVKITSMNIGYK